MAQKKSTKKAAARKTTARTANTANGKRKAAKKQELVVFALRMTLTERTKPHKTAGPRGATRLARAVLVAAANENESAFKAAVKAAREARS